MDESASAAARAADVRQADYFSQWLQEELEEVESRIASRRSVLAEYQARGDLAGTRQLQRMDQSDELERDHIRYMLNALHRRFPS